MVDVASMCLGIGSLLENRGCILLCPSGLLSNMPHRGPHTVWYILGLLGNRHSVRANRFQSPGSKGAMTVLWPKGLVYTVPSDGASLQDYVCLAGPEGACQALCTGFSPLYL